MPARSIESICMVAAAAMSRIAAIKLKPGSSVDQAELIAHCKTFLPSFKVPKKIDFRDQMPMSSFGKILRRDVRKSYWEHQEVKV